MNLVSLFQLLQGIRISKEGRVKTFENLIKRLTLSISVARVYSQALEFKNYKTFAILLNLLTILHYILNHPRMLVHITNNNCFFLETMLSFILVLIIREDHKPKHV
jgi:hypothetical protein